MASRRFFPEKVLSYAEDKAATEELPSLIDHLDSYVAGIKEASEVGRMKPGRESDVDDLIRRAHEGRRQIQAILRERGWKLLSDAKTWVAPKS